MDKEKDGNTINKSIFAVGLIAILLSLYQFRDEFSSIIIISKNNSSVSLMSVIIFFCFLLIISVYLYALHYVKYSFGEKIRKWSIFKVIIFLADLFYFLAMFFPILIFTIFITNKFNISTNNLLVFDVIISILSVILGIISAIVSYKNKK